MTASGATNSLTALRAPLLRPRDDGSVEFIPDAMLIADNDGLLTYAGPWQSRPPTPAIVEHCTGILCPPFVDIHTHIPQHPIRGRFIEGVPFDAPHGRLLAGLERNVWPAEKRFADVDAARRVITQMRDDTLSHGVIGGCTFATVHTAAARAALEILPPLWRVGPVLMNQNCPEDLRTDETAIETAMRDLAGAFGNRVVMTDRFAVAVGSALRHRMSRLASELSLRTQTHLNEQRGEKEFVENDLYPGRGSYTDIYRSDGLLDAGAILAHCIHCTDHELAIIRNESAVIAHCPTSNTLLGSGVMPLDRTIESGIDYAIATDVGASPSQSLLAEMAQFLTVHAGRSKRATPSEALYRATLAPAKILGIDPQCGRLEVGMPLSLIELKLDHAVSQDDSADEVILKHLLHLIPASDAERSALDALANGTSPHEHELHELERGYADRLGKVADVQRVMLDGKWLSTRA